MDEASWISRIRCVPLEEEEEEERIKFLFSKVGTD